MFKDPTDDQLEYVLIKCPFEKLLEIAEKLKYKMPIAENNLRSSRAVGNKEEDSDEDNESDHFVRDEFFSRYICKKNFYDRFQPAQIRHYYDRQDDDDDDDENVHNSNSRNTGGRSRKYFTAPYNSSMREKYCPRPFLSSIHSHPKFQTQKNLIFVFCLRKYKNNANYYSSSIL